MTPDEIDNWYSVKFRMADEGMDYCFKGYSNWNEIKDEEFHTLRNDYLKASEKLKNYIFQKVNEAEEQENN